jgi:hypothetical protein
VPSRRRGVPLEALYPCVGAGPRVLVDFTNFVIVT